MPKVLKDCQKLQWVAQNCHKFPQVLKSYHKLQKVPNKFSVVLVFKSVEKVWGDVGGVVGGEVGEEVGEEEIPSAPEEAWEKSDWRIYYRKLVIF